TVKPKLIGYWAPIPWCEPPPSWWREPPGESPWPDITRFVRPYWRPTDRRRIATYLRSGHFTGMSVSGDRSFWLSWAARETEGLRSLDPATALGLSEEVRIMADDPTRKREAMRLFRQQTQLGIKDAKQAIDNYLCLSAKRLTTVRA